MWENAGEMHLYSNRQNYKEAEEMIRLLLATFSVTLSGTCQPEQKPVEQPDLPRLMYFAPCMTGPDRPAWSCYGWTLWTGNRGSALTPCCISLPVGTQRAACWSEVVYVCEKFDVDQDGDIDLRDFAELQNESH